MYSKGSGKRVFFTSKTNKNLRIDVTSDFKEENTMKILVTSKVSDKGIQLLQTEHQIDLRYNLSPEELLSIIPEYHALIVRSDTKVPAELFEIAENLKVVGRAGVGVDNIDVQAATRKGVLVLNAPDGNITATTEYAFAMMLALARNIPQAHSAVRGGCWERSEFTGIEMSGKTLGIIGLGRIGSGVAARALAFGMNVLAYDPFINIKNAEELNVELVDLERIYAESDFITLHIPLTAETRHMLNQSAFSQMKKGVRIVQCSRGGVIDEAALLEAIQEKVVGGAALDVFEEVPVDSNHPLIATGKVICTPHIASYTEEALVGVSVDVAEGILLALRDEAVPTAVNVPPVSRTVAEFIRPYLHLAEKMGSLAVHLTDGRIELAEMKYNGEISDIDCKMITTAAVKGFINPLLQDEVNYVNAQGVARARGIKVREIKVQEAEIFTNLISIRIKTDKGEHRVAGTIFGKEEPRIVMIDGYRVDVEPRGWLLIVPHNDSPGMVGKVGSLLGEHLININGMQVGKTEQVGTNIMVVSVEQDISSDILSRLKSLEGIRNAQVVYFNGL
jgi:D-3-phosphoglycerate dehydrogenase / 2-oxoglutarate reductase